MKNIKHIWSVACKESVLNQDDNIISLHGVFEELTIDIGIKSEKEGRSIPEKLTFPINYEVVSMWSKVDRDGKAEAEVIVSLVAPDGEELIKSVPVNLAMPENIQRFRTRMKFAGLMIKREGPYVFRVKLKEPKDKEFQVVSEIPLEVKVTFKTEEN
jgi:hypothetical protein